MKSSDTIEELKNKSYAKNEKQVESQWLIFTNTTLEDNQTLLYYNIDPENTLYLMSRQTGTTFVFLRR